MRDNRYNTRLWMAAFAVSLLLWTGLWLVIGIGLDLWITDDPEDGGANQAAIGRFIFSAALWLIGVLAATAVTVVAVKTRRASRRR
jgi:hypothetical protein